jgi:predicted ribosome quality control (RQC) complex YloA/Tae2 family protein
LTQRSDLELKEAFLTEEWNVRLLHLRRELHKRLEKKERLIRGLEQDLAQASEFGRLREQADLLMVRLSQIQKGSARVELEDFEGKRRTITLDPALSPQKNAEKLYHKARKLERALPVMQSRLAKAMPEARSLRGKLDELDRAATPDQKNALLELLDLPSKTPRAPKKKQGKARTDSLKRQRSFWSGERLLIQVGRDDSENDRLTASARGNDLWFHVQNAPGSHVVVRIPKGRSASPPTLRDASLLAVHFSKLRGARRADVMYTPCKFVKRLRGSPGKVVVARHKTFSTVEDPVRLKELLNQQPQEAP